MQKTVQRCIPAGIAAIVLAVGLTGCGERVPESSSGGANESITLSAPAAPAAAVGKMDANAPVEMAHDAAGGRSGLAASGSTGLVAPENIPQPRKIIYTAETEVVTRDFAKGREDLKAAVARHGGFVAESNVSGTRGDTRTGTWKVRIPVAKFEAFLQDLGGMGDVENTRIGSQDVSEEFYDLEARLKNKRVEEDRLIQHLKISTGKLTEILAVEREISRVREEIERMEGRRRFLANQTDMTTVTVTLREATQLVPTTAPGLPDQLRQVFFESLAGIAMIGRATLLLIVGMMPFAALIGAIVWPIVYVSRRRKQVVQGVKAINPTVNAGRGMDA